MNYYTYKVADEEGMIVRGAIESADISSAYNELSAKGFYILSLKLSNRLAARIDAKIKARHIKRADIIGFANNLSVMLKAGVPLLSAMLDIINMTENRQFQKRILRVKRSIEMGMGFSGALEAQKDIFPDILMRLVKVGEETGRLDKSLSNVASHLQKMEDLSAAIKSAIIYPAFALVTTGGALLFWLVYVMPKIMSSLKEMGVKLPLITRVLLHISEFTQTFWYLIPVIAIAIFVIIKIMKQNEIMRYYIDALKLKLPIVQLIVHNKLLALFAEQLHILVVAGITIDRSFSIISEVMGNAVFKKAIVASREAVASGSGISDALKTHSVFPPLVIRMVNIGEASGTLDEQFVFLSDYYIKKLDGISKRMEKMIEPVVVVVVGLIFAVIIIGLMMPLYDLVSGIGK
ncbi:MAG: type II secretion system F family protein [Deltaproteobacteria bacterium]|nr:type II secretion system F family protein [Deltaproteobacteria bacterium]